MININFKKQYKALHFTNEIGKYIIGGIASFMNELYNLHGEDTGFVYIYDEDINADIDISYFPKEKDILAVSHREIHRLTELLYDIAIVHFYGLSFMADENILYRKKMIYVIHSVPTTEPYILENPFGGNSHIKQDFERMCKKANKIVCISIAEQEKLKILYPQFSNKVTVIHNGIYFDNENEYSKIINKERKKFGFIGRLDYRKGLRECIKSFKNIDGELYIACGRKDEWYLSSILDYIEGAELKHKIHFLGWCQGERKKSFLNSLDALIIPSLYEPFGYVVLEGIKEQTPLICSKGGGISEIIGSYKYCYEPYDEFSLITCIKQFQNDSIEEVEIEQKKLQQRKALFTTKLMNSKYEEIIDSLL